MKKIAIWAAAAVAALSMSACGAGEDDPEYQGVCVDPKTNVRLADSACESNSGISTSDAVMLWMLLGSGTTNNYVVPVGHYLPSGTNYVRTLPYNARIAPPAPRNGGTIKKDVKAAVPADKWVEKNPAYKGRVVQDNPPKPKPNNNYNQPNNNKKNNGGWGWGNKNKPAGGGYGGGYRKKRKTYSVENLR